MFAKYHSRILAVLVIVTSVAVTGCASYHSKLGDFEKDIRGGRPADAARALEEKANKESDDQIVYLFEYATALQMAKQFKASNDAFLKAEALTDIKDYHSLSRITGALLLNEAMIQYKGEDYEKVMVNAMLAIGYLMDGNFENAMVMARRLNEKLYKYKYEAKRNYEQNPFAFYLMAMLWEESRDWDSAYIQYKKTYELNPNIPYLAEDLVRAAKNAQREDDLAKWKKAFPNVKIPDQKNTGEVVLIYQQGWAPKKHPHPDFSKVPKLYPLFSTTQRAQLEIEKGVNEISEPVFSVADTAVKNLDDLYAELIAKRVVGMAAKAVVADQVRQKNQALGDLTWIALNLMDQADLRQWSSLPATFQVAKVRLKPGKYKVRAVGLSLEGKPTGEEMAWQEIEVKSRRKTFLNWRSVL